TDALKVDGLRTDLAAYRDVRRIVRANRTVRKVRGARLVSDVDEVRRFPPGPAREVRSPDDGGHRQDGEGRRIVAAARERDSPDARGRIGVEETVAMAEDLVD